VQDQVQFYPRGTQLWARSMTPTRDSDSPTAGQTTDIRGARPPIGGLRVGRRSFHKDQQASFDTMPMHRRLAIAILAFALPVLPGKWAIGAGWPLVTPGEEARDNAAPHLRQSATPAVRGAPAITVKHPDISRALRNPTTFEIQFRAAPGATINLSTFQAKYGWLGINITSRLLQHATRTPNGLFAADVNVPTGNHRISLSITDNLGRVGTRVVNLNVLR
jgi:hypothetical protein